MVDVLDRPMRYAAAYAQRRGGSEYSCCLEWLALRRCQRGQLLQARGYAMIVPHLLPKRQALRVAGPRARVVALLLRDDAEPEMRDRDAARLVPSLPEGHAFLV